MLVFIMADLNEPIGVKAPKLENVDKIKFEKAASSCFVCCDLFRNKCLENMSLIEEYYELNEAEEVSVIWKTLQIGFYACAACLGLWCGYTLAILRLRFEDRCYLFTEVKASAVVNGSIDQSSINWESDAWCDYYQFSMVSSFIVAIIWATFFLMCGKGGKSLTGLPQPWRIVWPSLIFNFLYFVIVLSTAISIQQGTDYFCARHIFQQKLQSKPAAESCPSLKWLLKKSSYITAVQLEIVVKTSWGCAASWFILFLLSFFRIVFVVDFYMYKICVFRIDDTIQNRKEEVLRITNYEEPKQFQFDKDEEKRDLYMVSADTIEDLKAGNRKKTKVDRKSMRQHFNAASRSPLQTNAAFYVMADLRMLARDKKKKSSKALNEMRLGSELRKSIKIGSQLNMSSTTETSDYLYGYRQEIYGEQDEGEMVSVSGLPGKAPKDDWDVESDSDGEILVGDYQTDDLLIFKKKI